MRDAFGSLTGIEPVAKIQLDSRSQTVMKIRVWFTQVASSWMALRRLKRRRGYHQGQAFVETMMATAFLVAIAIVINELFAPVVLEAFEKISEKLASVGP